MCFSLLKITVTADCEQQNARDKPLCESHNKYGTYDPEIYNRMIASWNLWLITRGGSTVICKSNCFSVFTTWSWFQGHWVLMLQVSLRPSSKYIRVRDWSDVHNGPMFIFWNLVFWQLIRGCIKNIFGCLHLLLHRPVSEYSGLG